MKHFYLLSAFIIISTISNSQGIIQGRIFQNDSTVLSSVSVYLENTTLGTSSNASGNFKIINVPSGEYTLITSSVGYKKITKKIIVKDNETQELSLVLTESATDLSEFTLAASITGGNTGVKKMPGSAYYISPKELKKFSYTDINRSLRAVPGVNLTEEDCFGLRTNIGLRGTGTERSSKITVMEDGILIAPAPYAAPAAYYFPTAGRIQAIEIMKGSSQIKYGPYTTGGAINLISTQIPDEFSGKLDILAGSYDYKQMHATMGDSYKNISYVIETFQYGSDGFKKLDVDGNTGFDKKDYVAKLKFNTNKNAKIYQSISFKIAQANEISDETYLGITEADFKKNHIRRYAGSQVDEMKTQQRAFSATHFAKFSKNINSTTTAYRTEFSRNWYKLNNLTDTSGKKVNMGNILDNPEDYSELYNVLVGNSSINEDALTVRANNRTYEAMGVQTALNFNFKTKALTHNIDVGIRYHIDEMDRFQWEDKYQMKDGAMLMTKAGIPGTQDNKIESASALATYIQYKLNYEKLTITPGIRYENILLEQKDFGKNDVKRTGSNLKERENQVDVFIPGISIDYQLNKSLNAFVGVHKGFAPPGNTPDVNPEESINYEAGISYYKNAFTIKFVGFYNDYKNLLGSDLEAGGGAGTSDLFNGGKAQSQGIELFISYDFLTSKYSKFRLPLTVSYTYMDATFQNDFLSSFEPWGTVSKGDHLPYLANNQLNVMLALEHSKFSVSIRGNYMDAMRTEAGIGSIPSNLKTDAYVVIDANITYKFYKETALFASVTNMLDNEYMVARRPSGLRPGMPRMFIVGLKANF
ncbi:MAG: TonB-dependent receptor [Vicingaceae bacterium]|nr:TonB-dependent receptor [Vicingaceae bacterium]